MAKRRSTPPAAAKRPAEPYTHPTADAASRPEAGTQAQFRKKKQLKTCAYDSSLSPQLQWAGKAERLSFDVPTLPLFVHERLSTQAILETVGRHKRRPEALGLSVS